MRKTKRHPRISKDDRREIVYRVKLLEPHSVVPYYISKGPGFEPWFKVYHLGRFEFVIMKATTMIRSLELASPNSFGGILRVEWDNDSKVVVSNNHYSQQMLMMLRRAQVLEDMARV